MARKNRDKSHNHLFLQLSRVLLSLTLTIIPRISTGRKPLGQMRSPSMTVRVSSPRSASCMVGVYLPSQSWQTAPAFSVSREEARRWRDEGQAEFGSKGRSIRLTNFKVPQPRSKQLGICKTCGGGSFHTIVPGTA
jgi:hypothetical protein